MGTSNFLRLLHREISLLCREVHEHTGASWAAPRKTDCSTVGRDNSLAKVQPKPVSRTVPTSRVELDEGLEDALGLACEYATTIIANLQLDSTCRAGQRYFDAIAVRQ